MSLRLVQWVMEVCGCVSEPESGSMGHGSVCEVQWVMEVCGCVSESMCFSVGHAWRCVGV